ncbi:MAG: NifU family protein [Candidatus Acidiferrales bacterium]
MPEQKELQRRIESIESLIREIELVSDPAVRSLSKQLIQSLMDLHGSGLERMLEIVHGSGEAGQKIIEVMGHDDLVRNLLLLYDLHPVGLQERVMEALEKSRPYLRSHGGNVEFVGVSESGAVTLRLAGSCHSCPSSAVTLQSTVEQAIYDAAPDVTEIIVEGTPPVADPPASFIPLASLQANGMSPAHITANSSRTVLSSAGQTDWEDVFGLDAIPSGTLQMQQIGGQRILFCKLNEDFYAYGVTCPGCGQHLEGGLIENTILVCPICRQRYDLVHAGRGVDIATLHLDPIPLLHENGRAKVAIISRVERSAT